MKSRNLITLTDSYKVTHHMQYPPDTQIVHSYLESRGGRWPEVTFFGLQYLLKEYLEGVRVTAWDVARAKAYFAKHFGADHFNEKGWLHILEAHGGRIPLSISAVPEGTTVPVSNVLMTVENTCPGCYWVTNYLETLLVQVWYPLTVCTNSRMSRKLILRYLEETGDPSLIDFKLHDFGFRGSTSVESAGIGGAAHLVNFNGTDTLAAIDVAYDYYHEEMAGFSIPAAEHSTIISWDSDHEADAFRNMLEKFPTGLVAVVSDSYDIFKAAGELWGDKLRERVLYRQGVLVVRPDSGHPTSVVPRLLDILGDKFGYKRNAKSYRVLNEHVRIIQGDGIDYTSTGDILEAMKAARWSADNIAFGSGGGLLQKVDRDSQKMAFKASAVCINGVWRDVFKSPVTDPGKHSKRGRLALIKEPDGTYRTVQAERLSVPNQLVEVFRDGELLRDYTFSEIRQRARAL